MDSDDDMHDANDVESVEDDDDEGFYSDEMGFDYYCSDDDADVDYVIEDDAEDFERIHSRRPEVILVPPFLLNFSMFSSRESFKKKKKKKEIYILDC